MKIIFNSEKEKRNFIDNIKKCVPCPERIGLQEYCSDSESVDCYECWEKALNGEVKEQ